MTKIVVNKLVNVFNGALFTVLAIGTLSTGQAQAIVLSFDDLPATSEFDGELIPSGYGGLNWDNFYYLTTPSYSSNPSGYLNGTVSTPNVAYNGGGDPAIVSTGSSSNNNTTFDFNSAYLTGAWNNGLNILVEGFSGGIVKYSKTVTVDTTSPTQFNFDFIGINSLKFTSFGGVDAGYDGGGTNIVLDNFTYNEPVPEPITIFGSLTAAGVGVALRRKQKQQQKAISKV